MEQRAKLQAKNHPSPHVLAMTATPIPRTLSMVAHGDMAISAIDELPPGRTPVETKVFSSNNKADRAGVYKYVLMSPDSP